MCNFKSQAEKTAESLADYYSVAYSKVLDELYEQRYFENGFDHKATPILTVGKPQELQYFNWGLVPSRAKDLSIRKATLNARSEEVLEKSSYRDAFKNNQRCLIPSTGFFEWQWQDQKGKSKIPFFIGVKDQPLFSMGGLYSRWKDPATGIYYYSYTILTTEANPLMKEVHNHGQRMPVIIPREYEKDWLNPNLTYDDIMALCKGIPSDKMQAHTIARFKLNDQGLNVPERIAAVKYEPQSLF